MPYHLSRRMTRSQMTEMARRRRINLKVLGSMKSLGRTKAVTIECETEVTIRVAGSIGIFFDTVDCFGNWTQLSNAAHVLQRWWAYKGLVPNQNRAS